MSGRRRPLALLLAPALGGLIAALPAHADYAFGPPEAHPGGVAATDRVLFAGDFTGDTHADLAWQAGSVLRLLRGRGDGTFQASIDVATGLAGTGPAALAVDLNGDGLLDTVHVSHVERRLLPTGGNHLE